MGNLVIIATAFMRGSFKEGVEVTITVMERGKWGKYTERVNKLGRRLSALL